MQHILIVDDYEAVRTSVCRLLRSAGYHAVAVADGEAALDAMRAERPALVLLDVSMQGLSGLGVLRAAGADPSLAGVPIVMLTADEDPATRAEAERLGARGFLQKGRDWPDSLWRVIDQFLDPPESAARST
jgi:putative two-component system response regulator